MSSQHPHSPFTASRHSAFNTNFQPHHTPFDPHPRSQQQPHHSMMPNPYPSPHPINMMSDFSRSNSTYGQDPVSPSKHKIRRKQPPPALGLDRSSNKPKEVERGKGPLARNDLTNHRKSTSMPGWDGLSPSMRNNISLDPFPEDNPSSAAVNPNPVFRPSSRSQNPLQEAPFQHQNHTPDPNREIARPPAEPRAPIRHTAHNPKLTSVHIGVKPRVPGVDPVGDGLIRMSREAILARRAETAYSTGRDDATDLSVVDPHGDRKQAYPGDGLILMREGKEEQKNKEDEIRERRAKEREREKRKGHSKAGSERDDRSIAARSARREEQETTPVKQIHARSRMETASTQTTPTPQRRGRQEAVHQRSATEGETIEGVGMGYGKRPSRPGTVFSEQDDDARTESTARAHSVTSSESRSTVTFAEPPPPHRSRVAARPESEVPPPQSAKKPRDKEREEKAAQNAYNPLTARPTFTIEQQSAKYDEEYRSRLARLNLQAPAEQRQWREKVMEEEEDDDPRQEGVYTFDYSSRGKNQKTRRRIAEYDDPTRPGQTLHNRKYLPEPVDEREYGVPIARRVRAFIREREWSEAQGIPVAPPSVIGSPDKSEIKGRQISTPAVVKERIQRLDEASNSPQRSAKVEKAAKRKEPPRQVMQPVPEWDEDEITPKARMTALPRTNRHTPSPVKSNPNLRRAAARTPEKSGSSPRAKDPKREERKREKEMRRMRSEPELRDGGRGARQSEMMYAPPMPEGEEYDEETEMERQAAWKQYYESMSQTGPQGGEALAMGIGMGMGMGMGLNQQPHGALGLAPYASSDAMTGQYGQVFQHPQSVHYGTSPAVPSKDSSRKPKSRSKARPASVAMSQSSGMADMGSYMPTPDSLMTPQYTGYAPPDSYFGYHPPHPAASGTSPYPPFDNASPYAYGATPPDPQAMAYHGSQMPANMDGRGKGSWYGRSM